MKKIHKLQDNSAYIGTLPVGCIYCGPGEKLVLLITGKCRRRCYYCPLSFAKRGKDVTYADELRVNKFEDIIQEAHAISAKGTGITGGDPMLVPDRTLKAIRLLKSTFGDNHHIHLYTSGNFNTKYISQLTLAGLDELRLHPPYRTWGGVDEQFDHLLKLAVQSELSVGAELPVLPGHEEDIIKFARYIDSRNVEFLNLNELEFSESNWHKCKSRGYVQKNPISNSVLGSEEAAYKILTELAAEDEFELNIHYCSAQFKDRQQLRNRLIRRAKRVIRPIEVLTDDGTFLLGIIEPTASKDLKELDEVRRFLIEKFGIFPNLVNLDYDKKRLEIASWVLSEIKQKVTKTLRKRCFIIEEYPSADRLEVERIPLVEFG